MGVVEAHELAAIADPDARDNYAVFLAFRDAVVAAGSLEAYYLRLVRGGPIAVPPPIPSPSSSTSATRSPTTSVMASASRWRAATPA
jgi:hypothetical protein